MDSAEAKRIIDDIKLKLTRAQWHQEEGDDAKMRANAEAAAAQFRQLLADTSDSFGMFELLTEALTSFGYTAAQRRKLLTAEKKKRKINVRGIWPGGAEHKKGKRASTKNKHEKGDADKRKSYGGEKGDDGRRYPRSRPDGWKGPWPPPS